MADRKQEARAHRTAARDRRRASVTEPFEELDQAAREQGDESTSQPNGELRRAAAKVVGSAVAAAFLGALGGAAKALLERRGDDVSQTPEQRGEAGEEDARAEDEAATESPAAAEEADGDDQRSHAQQGSHLGDEQSEPAEESEHEAPERAEANDEGTPKEQAQEVSDDEGAAQQHAQEASNDESAQNQRRQGVSADEGAEIVAQARRQLEGLLGTEAERVSGLQRVDGGWSVMLEVVEVSRVPESTDVLATYEVALDDDRNLVSVNRGRRYRRSQIDEAS
jgi:hypothetical protein